MTQLQNNSSEKLCCSGKRVLKSCLAARSTTQFNLSFTIFSKFATKLYFLFPTDIYLVPF